MKKFSLTMLALALVFVIVPLVLTACDNGGGSSVSKPSLLSDNATYRQAVDKCDEIIAYCNAHPSQNNNGFRGSAYSFKTGMSNMESMWSSAGSSFIQAINTLIMSLD